MTGLRGELSGCGFFASNYLHAWREIEGADIVAVCDLEKARAQECAREFGVGAVYEDADAMLRADICSIDRVSSGVPSHFAPSASYAPSVPVIGVRSVGYTPRGLRSQRDLDNSGNP